MRTPRRALIILAGMATLIASAGACTRPGPGPGQPGPGTGPQHVQIKYGPFTIPGADQPATGIFAGVAPFLGGQSETGMIWNAPRVNVTKPCSDCYITGLKAGLITPDGQNANINRGLWLHHMVLLASGRGKRDATCPSGLQQVAIGRMGAERVFASGNERTFGNFDAGYGYRMNPADQLHLLVDLMNMNEAPQAVYMTLDYDFVPGSTPGTKNVRPLWFDAAQCGISEVPGRTGQYTVQSGTWTSTVAGKFLMGGGHVHDGGTHLTIEQNGQVVCDSVAAYGETPEYRAGGAMDHDMGGMDHGDMGGWHESISSMNFCHNFGDLRVGDRMHITGYYDDSQHAQMSHGGKLHNVMAIALVYIGLAA